MKYQYKKYPVEQGNEYSAKAIAKANWDLITSYAVRADCSQDVYEAFLQGCKDACSSADLEAPPQTPPSF